MLRRYSLMFSRELAFIAFAIPFCRQLLWITTYNCHSYFHSQVLMLLQDTWNYSSKIKYPLFPYLTVIVARMPLRIIPHTYRGFVRPQLSWSSQNPSNCYSIFRN